MKFKKYCFTLLFVHGTANKTRIEKFLPESEPNFNTIPGLQKPQIFIDYRKNEHTIMGDISLIHHSHKIAFLMVRKQDNWKKFYEDVIDKLKTFSKSDKINPWEMKYSP